jgi:hypothetical protein
MKPARFFLLMLLVAALMLASIGTLNVVVDPLQQYRLPSAYAPRFYPALQRHQNVGLARRAHYTRIVMGSSLMENVDTRDVDRVFGSGRAINLSISAMTAFDAAQLLRIALATGKPQHVIIHLDYNAFSGAADRSGFADAFPAHLYNHTVLDDAPYWFDVATTAKSLSILSRKSIGARFSTDQARPWYWADGVTFSAEKALGGLDLTNINRDYKQPARTLGGMLASFDANILPLLREHPEVKFSLVYLPYSALVWMDFEQRQQTALTLAFRTEALARTFAFTNVEWFDFQADAPLVSELSHYTDIYHFSPRVSATLMQRIAEGSGRVNAAMLQQNNAWLAELAAQDVRRFVSNARSVNASNTSKH